MYLFKLTVDINKRFVFWMLGVQDELLTFGVVIDPLQCRLVLDNHSGYLAVIYDICFLNKYDITVKNSRAYHAVALRTEAKICVYIRASDYIALTIFIGVYRLAARYIPQ